MIKICISVMSHALDPLPLSQTVTPSRTPSPLQRDVLYGRPPTHFSLPGHLPSVNCSRPKGSSIYDIHKNLVFDPLPLSTWAGLPYPLWRSTRGRHEIHTALLKWLVQ